MLDKAAKEQFHKHHELADTHWWFVGLRDLVLHFVNESHGNDLKILDAGCGVGHMLQSLRRYGDGYGVDSSPEAIQFCKARGLINIAQASVEKLPFAGEFFDAVVCLDVLYHLGVKDDLGALLEFNRVLKKGGLLIINVPAYNFLRSGHDVIACTRHRYTSGELEKKVRRAGFKIKRITYRNSLLFPIAFVTRLFNKFINRSSPQNELRILPNSVNRILTETLLLENKILSRIRLPFGLSVFCVAHKEGLDNNV